MHRDIIYNQNKFKNLISDPHNLKLQMAFIKLLKSVKSPDSTIIQTFNNELQKVGETLDYDLSNGMLDLLDAPILQSYNRCKDKEYFKNQLNNMYVHLFADYQQILPWGLYWDIINIRYYVKYGLVDTPEFKLLLDNILEDYDKYIDEVAPIYKHYFSKFMLELYLLIYMDFLSIYQNWVHQVKIEDISNITKESLNYNTYEIKFFSLERNL